MTRKLLFLMLHTHGQWFQLVLRDFLLTPVCLFNFRTAPFYPYSHLGMQGKGVRVKQFEPFAVTKHFDRDPALAVLVGNQISL
jgi:hypothetical protein